MPNDVFWLVIVYYLRQVTPFKRGVGTILSSVLSFKFPEFTGSRVGPKFISDLFSKTDDL